MDDKRQSYDTPIDETMGNYNPVDGQGAQKAPQNQQPDVPAGVLQVNTAGGTVAIGEADEETSNVNLEED